jgi:hypothetical protein
LLNISDSPQISAPGSPHQPAFDTAEKAKIMPAEKSMNKSWGNQKKHRWSAVFLYPNKT